MRIFGEAFRRQNKKMQLFLLAIAIVGVVLIVAGVLLMRKHSTKDDTTRNEAESKSVIAAVDKLYILPSGDTPTVAAIQDKNKLANQEFFKDAQDGDYVLVYPKAKTALLYRKSVNKLVNAGPVNLNNASGHTQNTSH